MRLHVLLARAGVLSRQRNKGLVRSGAVSVDGRIVLEPFAEIDPITQHVEIAGIGRVRLPTGWTYVLMNKPRGHVSAMTDPEGRPTLEPYFPAEMPSVHPVGRLDFNTEGALLLTDDGELAHRVLHPDWHLPKLYRVKVRGHLRHDEPAFDAIRAGVELDGERTRPVEVEWEAHRARATWLRLTLREGRHRQIRRTCALFDWQIVKLQRVAIGPIGIGDLTPRTWRLLDAHEIAALASAVSLVRPVPHATNDAESPSSGNR
ncbi:MAG: rRNA pseudouridine synthase [Deltaproteobacteria bacterium]|nr:rRNA pseudouridine synthase [Deltaproteobacteria bacterium]